MTACFTLVSAASCLPARCFLRGQKRLNSADLTVPTGLAAGYGATAGRLPTILSAVPISRPVTSIFLDPVRSIWLASDLQQTTACCRLSPHVYRHLTPISSTPAYKRWGHGGTNAQMPLTATWKSNVNHLLRICRVYSKVRKKKVFGIIFLFIEIPWCFKTRYGRYV